MLKSLLTPKIPSCAEQNIITELDVIMTKSWRNVCRLAGICFFIMNIRIPQLMNFKFPLTDGNLCVVFELSIGSD